MKKIILMLIVLSCSVNASEEHHWNKGISPYFTVYLTGDSEFYSWGNEGPCGKYLNLQGFKFPLENENFEITWVYELDEAGNRINKWPVPTDSSTISVSGDVLTVNTLDKYNPYVHINQKGEIIRGPQSIKVLPESKFVDCPIKNNSNYTYEACLKIYDPTLKKSRVLSTWSICT